MSVLCYIYFVNKKTKKKQISFEYINVTDFKCFMFKVCHSYDNLLKCKYTILLSINIK